MKQHILRYLRQIVRKKNVIDFSNLQDIEPVSSVFGYDRGQPIDRYYIEGFLNQNKSLIRGAAMEIAESQYMDKFGTSITKKEILHVNSRNKKATIIGDLSKPETLPSGVIDCFICTQTYGFIFDVSKAIQGSYQLLKPGGYLLATVSGISQISRYDMDNWGEYWRFTDASVYKLFEPIFGKENIQIQTHGNVISSIAFLQGISVEDMPAKKLLDQKDPNYQLIITIIAKKTG